MRRGRVALELHVPDRGGLVIETIEANEVVGWSWLFEPYRWHFDARAVEDVARDRVRRRLPARQVRRRPALGYELMRRFAQVMIDRLQHTRTPAPGRLWRRRRQLSAARRGRDGAGALPRDRRATQETADTWTLELEPLGEPIAPAAPGQFDMLYAFGVGEVPISTSGARDGAARLTHTIRAVGAVTRALCAAEPGAVLGVRGPFGTTWPLEAAAGGDLVIVAGGIGLAPLRPAIYHALAHRDDYGSVCRARRRPDAGDLLYVCRARAVARPLRRSRST